LLQNIAAKEFGHALGIKATSPDPKDLMYPDLVSDHAKFPTNRDLATLTQIYTRPANILLNVQSQITGKY
jgi:predicted Zn-dependent protease